MRFLPRNMMCTNALTIRVLLLASSTRIEEVVDALEGSVTLACNFATLVEAVLQLDVREAGKHLI